MQIVNLDPERSLPDSIHELRREEQRLMKSKAIRDVTIDDVPRPFTKRDGFSMLHSTYQPKAYFFDLFQQVEDLLTDTELYRYLNWRFNPSVSQEAKDQRSISDLNSANWWQHEQSILGKEANILAIILSMDETPVTFNGRSMHPVYLTLGNIPLDLR